MTRNLEFKVRTFGDGEAYIMKREYSNMRFQNGTIEADRALWDFDHVRGILKEAAGAKYRWEDFWRVKDLPERHARNMVRQHRILVNGSNAAGYADLTFYKQREDRSESWGDLDASFYCRVGCSREVAFAIAKPLGFLSLLAIPGSFTWEGGYRVPETINEFGQLRTGTLSSV